ncbi:hypothetical protein J6590_040401 [Homalodisca vitripennis]|nr:hypothetical protein J6590_040399 [Homalodisca vitripennis]KAG8292440.1 hypothetical protein J6590_040401 [Homalodisca vitripennis]
MTSCETQTAAWQIAAHFWQAPLFCPSSWATGLCEDLIKQSKGESRYSTRLMVLVQRTQTGFEPACAISNSVPKSNDLDRSAVGTPDSWQDLAYNR